MSDPDQPRTYPAGVTCWIDTEQDDVDAATAFYGGLLGWTFEDVMPPGAPTRYVMARLDGKDAAAIGGPRHPDAGGSPPTWNTYVAVDDADRATARLVGLGARVLSDPADAGPGGRTSTLADPEGAEVRLWQARARLGAQVANQPGAWNFSDLHAVDPETAGRFYADAFGWRLEGGQGWATMIQVPGYGDHLEATVDPDIRTRQAEAHTPPGFEDVIGSIVTAGEGEAPHWHVTIAIADRDETAARAEQLGATVLSSAEDDWTRTAVVRDPQGAVLTLSQFTPHGTS